MMCPTFALDLRQCDARKYSARAAALVDGKLQKHVLTMTTLRQCVHLWYGIVYCAMYAWIAIFVSVTTVSLEISWVSTVILSHPWPYKSDGIETVMQRCS